LRKLHTPEDDLFEGVMILDVELIHIVIERIVLGKRNVARIHRLLVVVQYEVGVQDCHTFFACIFLSKTSEFKSVYLRVYLKGGFA
jgi:hypothetical protein